MRNYFQSVVERFARRVFPEGVFLIVGEPQKVADQYDYIWVKSEGDIEMYYPHLSPGGIMSGIGKTDRLDTVRFEDVWFHVKPAEGKFSFTPVILTIDHTRKAIAEMDKFGIQYKLFEGIKHKAGHIGCARSYYKIFEQNRDKDMLMVFEDDVQFVRSPLTFSLDGVPEDWDAVYLGANIKAPCDNSYQGFSRMFSAWTTHAILWRRSLMDKVLAEFDPDKGMPIDEWLNRRMYEIKCYVTNPFYAVQRAGRSTIAQSDTDYITIFNSQNRLI